MAVSVMQLQMRRHTDNPLGIAQMLLREIVAKIHESVQVGAIGENLPQLRLKAATLPEDGPAPESDPDNSRLAIFTLHRRGGGSIWFSEGVCTLDQWNYILEFLDRVRVKVLELRDDDPSLDT
jgi:hypothetical protein